MLGIGSLIILAVIYAVQRLTSTMTTTEKSTPFSGLDTSKVNRVSIVTTKGIVIVKQEGRWLIISPIHYPADQGQVSIILSRIAANPSASVVADNMSDSSAYGLGSRLTDDIDSANRRPYRFVPPWCCYARFQWMLCSVPWRDEDIELGDEHQDDRRREFD